MFLRISFVMQLRLGFFKSFYCHDSRVKIEGGLQKFIELLRGLISKKSRWIIDISFTLCSSIAADYRFIPYKRLLKWRA